MKPSYPTWVCSECAMAEGGKRPALAAFHPGICDICLKEKMVTEPRDYRLTYIVKTKGFDIQEELD